MTFPITCYDVFWNARQQYGGVNVLLSDERQMCLTTQQPAVLEFWAKLLQTHPVLYYNDGDSEGLCTARELPYATRSPSRGTAPTGLVDRPGDLT